MRPQRPQRPARAQHPARGRRKLFRRLYWLTFAMYCPDDDDDQSHIRILDAAKAQGAVWKTTNKDRRTLPHDKRILEVLTPEEREQFKKLPERPEMQIVRVAYTAEQAKYAAYLLRKQGVKIVAGCPAGKVDKYPTPWLTKYGVHIWKSYARWEKLAAQRRTMKENNHG